MKDRPVKRTVLWKTVAQTLRREILAKPEPGHRLDAEPVLARRYGVSIVTLREAVLSLIKDGLLERRHGKGTFVADQRKQQAVAVATATSPGQIGSSFQIRLFLLLCELFQRRGYRCRAYVAPVKFGGGWIQLIEDVERGRIAGAAFVAMNATLESIPFAEHGVPYLQYDGSPGSVGLDWVDLVRTGARHLLEQGCRRIALMQWLGETSQQREIQAAFEATLAEFQAPVHEEWIRRTVPPETPGAGWEQFREIWAAREDKPDGLLVTDDVMSRDVALAILDSRIKVPQQLKVVVHANKGSGVTYPFPVSLLEVDLDEWAEAMVDRLIKLMNHEPVGPAVPPIRARLIPAGKKPAGPVLNVAQSGLNLETSTK